MKPFALSPTSRLVLMALTLLAIALLGVLGAAWATPAHAQGTVDGISDPPGGNGDSGVCGALPAVQKLEGNANVTKVQDLGFADHQFVSDQSAVGAGTVRPLFVPLTQATVEAIDAGDLKASPPGWTNLACGLQVSALAGSRAATYVRHGQATCFDLPIGVTATYKSLRLAYWDTALGRWVFLKTKVGAASACNRSFRLLPATFSLFGGN